MSANGTRQQYERILREHQSIDIPSPGTDDCRGGADAGAQRELHILTTILRRYKALVFSSPSGAEQVEQGDEEAVDRLMAQTKSIRDRVSSKNSSSVRKYITPFRGLLAAAAAVLIAFSFLLYNNVGGTRAAEVALVNGLSRETRLSTVRTRGASGRLAPEEITKLISSQFQRRGLEKFQQWDLPGLIITQERVPRKLFSRIGARYVVSITRIMAPDARPALVLLLYDSREKAVIRHEQIPGGKPNAIKKRVTGAIAAFVEIIRKQDEPQ